MEWLAALRARCDPRAAGLSNRGVIAADSVESIEPSPQIEIRPRVAFARVRLDQDVLRKPWADVSKRLLDLRFQQYNRHARPFVIQSLCGQPRASEIDNLNWSVGLLSGVGVSGHLTAGFARHFESRLAQMWSMQAHGAESRRLGSPEPAVRGTNPASSSAFSSKSLFDFAP